MKEYQKPFLETIDVFVEDIILLSNTNEVLGYENKEGVFNEIWD